MFAGEQIKSHTVQTVNLFASFSVLAVSKHSRRHPNFHCSLSHLRRRRRRRGADGSWNKHFNPLSEAQHLRTLSFNCLRGNQSVCKSLPGVHCNVALFIFSMPCALSPISHPFPVRAVIILIPMTNELSEDISSEGVL